MIIDSLGVRRYKIGLHCHTTLSDGHRTPEEACAVYAAHDFDMLALTDHWVWGKGGDYAFTRADGSEGHMKLIPGCEYHVGDRDAAAGVYHIVALDAPVEPALTTALRNDTSKSIEERGRVIVDAIHAAGGFAVLAHPAWSLNTTAGAQTIGGFDATEIYNSVSDWGMSCRPYSGLFVDQLAGEGTYLPLLATDDTHYYDGDQCRGFIMADADAVDSLGLGETIRRGLFYASMGPEIHLSRLDADTVKLTCSPAVQIAFLSHFVWAAGRMIRGKELCEAAYRFMPGERFVRAEITTADGKCAWSNIIVR